MGIKNIEQKNINAFWGQNMIFGNIIFIGGMRITWYQF